MRPVAAIAGITLAVEILMIVAGMGPDVILVAALGVLVGVGIWFVTDLVGVAQGSAAVATGPAPPSTERADRRVMRLRTGLAYGRPDGVSLANLRVSLVDLIDDQLRAVHNIDRSRDPEAARAVIGDDLSAFIDDPDAADKLTQPRSLDHILTLIEQL